MAAEAQPLGVGQRPDHPGGVGPFLMRDVLGDHQTIGGLIDLEVTHPAVVDQLPGVVVVGDEPRGAFFIRYSCKSSYKLLTRVFMR